MTTADTTASAAASLPSKEEVISHDNPAANAFLIANRSNGDLDNHRLLNLLKGGCGKSLIIHSLNAKLFVNLLNGG